MDKNTIRVGSVVAKPGSTEFGILNVGEFFDGSCDLKIGVMNGPKPGPKLWVQGLMHGDEHCSIEVIRRLFINVKPNELKGAVIAVPVVNLGGFQAMQREGYIDGVDAERIIPDPE